MNTDIPKYDPEDLESLMAHKPYDALYPEEKAFVLKHLESPEEYDSMRAMLLKLQERAPDDHITPDPQLKEDLMTLFETEKKGGFLVWLNGTFASLMVADRPWFRQPAFAYAMAAGIFLFGAWFILQQDDGQELIAKTEDVRVNPADSENEIDKSDEVSPVQEAETSQEEPPVNATEDALSKTGDVPALPDVPEEVTATESEMILTPDMDLVEEMESEPAFFDTEMTVMEEDDAGEYRPETSPDADMAMEDAEETDAVTKHLKESDKAIELNTSNGVNLAMDDAVNFTIDPSLTDTNSRLLVNQTLDNYAGNSSIQPTFSPDLNQNTAESLSAVTIESTAVENEEGLSTRGLDFAYTEVTPGSVPVKAFDELLDLLYTAW